MNAEADVPNERPQSYTLRVSLTRRCALRCLYCHTPDAVAAAAKDLDSEDLLRLIAALARQTTLGKLRLTGGEPLLFSGLVPLVERLHALWPESELCLTTNGLELARFAKPLKAAGLSRLTVSLDAAEPSAYRRITGVDGFAKVLEGLEEARRAGFTGLKLNTVLLATHNAATLAEQLRLALRFGAEARFIELMPLGPAKALFAREHLSAQEALNLLARDYPEQTDLGQDGTARRFRLAGPQGQAEIGLITPLSAPFCGACNRLRLDSNGRFYTCLRQETGYDLAEPLRAGDVARLERRLATALAEKHPLLVWPERPMQSLGG